MVSSSEHEDSSGEPGHSSEASEDAADFTGENEDSELPTAIPPFTLSETIRKRREDTRSYIAYGLIAILAGTIILSFILLLADKGNSPGVADLLKLVVAPLIGLIGAATGYYFGTRERQ